MKKTVTIALLFAVFVSVVSSARATGRARARTVVRSRAVVAARPAVVVNRSVVVNRAATFVAANHVASVNVAHFRASAVVVPAVKVQTLFVEVPFFVAGVGAVVSGGYGGVVHPAASVRQNSEVSGELRAVSDSLKSVNDSLSKMAQAINAIEARVRALESTRPPMRPSPIE